MQHLIDLLECQINVAQLQIQCAEWKGPERYEAGTIVDGKNVGGKWKPKDKDGGSKSSDSAVTTATTVGDNIAKSLAQKISKLTSEQLKAVNKSSQNLSWEICKALSLPPKAIKAGIKKIGDVLIPKPKGPVEFLKRHSLSITLCVASVGLGMLAGYLVALAAADFAASIAAVGILRTMGLVIATKGQPLWRSLLLSFGSGSSSISQVALGLAKLKIGATLGGIAVGHAFLAWLAGTIGAAQSDDFTEMCKSITLDAKDLLLSKQVKGEDVAAVLGLKVDADTQSEDFEDLLKAFQSAIRSILAGTPQSADLEKVMEGFNPLS